MDNLSKIQPTLGYAMRLSAFLAPFRPKQTPETVYASQRTSAPPRHAEWAVEHRWIDTTPH